MVREPQEVRSDIEATRERLGSHLDTLSDKVAPSKVAERRVDDARRAASTVREKLMGAARQTREQVGDADSTDRMGDQMSMATSSLRETAGSAKETVTSAPDAVHRGAEGSPLAAGLIAFGVGLLASSLIPASQREEQVGGRLKEQAGRLAEPLKDSAREVSDELRPQAQEVAESLRGGARDAAAQVRESAKS